MGEFNLWRLNRGFPSLHDFDSFLLILFTYRRTLSPHEILQATHRDISRRTISGLLDAPCVSKALNPKAIFNHSFTRDLNAWAPSDIGVSSASPPILPTIQHTTGFQEEDAEEDWYDLNVTEVVPSTLENPRGITALETLMTSKVVQINRKFPQW